MNHFPRRKSFLILLAVLIIGTTGAILSPVLHAQTQAEMNVKAGSEYKQADATMTTAYKKLMGKVGKKEQARLKKSQIAWLKFRDAEADFLSSKVVGGSIYPMIHATHLKQLTAQRTKQLNDAYTLFTTEGDM